MAEAFHSIGPSSSLHRVQVELTFTDSLLANAIDLARSSTVCLQVKKSIEIQSNIAVYITRAGDRDELTRT